MVNDLPKYTKDNIIETLQRTKGRVSNNEEYAKFINNCDDSNLLMEIYNIQKQSNPYSINKILKSNEKQEYCYVNRTALFSVIPLKLVSLAIERKCEEATCLFEEYEKIQDKNYNDLMHDLTHHNLLNLSQVKFIDRKRLDRLFDNYKQVKNKVRLYCFAINIHFDEVHREIALRYLGMSSFKFHWSSYPVPFKLSYLTRVNNPKEDLMRLVSEAVRPFNSYGTVWTSSGAAQINVEIDMSEKQIKTMLFPIMVNKIELYERMLANLGMICPRCLDKGKVAMWNWKNKEYDYVPCSEKKCEKGQEFRLKLKEAQNVN